MGFQVGNRSSNSLRETTFQKSVEPIRIAFLGSLRFTGKPNHQVISENMPNPEIIHAVSISSSLSSVMSSRRATTSEQCPFYASCRNVFFVSTIFVISFFATILQISLTAYTVFLRYSSIHGIGMYYSPSCLYSFYAQCTSALDRGGSMCFALEYIYFLSCPIA